MASWKSTGTEPHPTPTGHSGVTIYWGQVTGEEDNEEVLREKWYGDVGRPGIADQMIRTDAHIRASLSTVIHPITQAIWGVRSATPWMPTKSTPLVSKERAVPTPRETAYSEHARFVEYNLVKKNSLDRYVRQALDYLKSGFSLFELTTDFVEVPAELFPLHLSPEIAGKKQALMITGIEPRLPRTVKRWIMNPDAPARVKAIEQLIPGDDQTTGFDGTIAPANRLRKQRALSDRYKRLDFSRADGTPAVIRHSFDQVGNDPEGLAQLRSIYFAWRTKRALRILEAIRHERQNLGVPTISLPAGFNKDDEAKAKLILEALRGHERAYIVLPNGFLFQWNTSGTGQGTNVQAAIEYCDREIWMNVLAPFMLLGGNGDTGSYALAETINDVRLLGLEAHVKMICEPWNIGFDTEAIIPWLVRMNYGEQVDYPFLCAENLPTRNWEKILPIMLQGVQAGVVTVDDPFEDFFRQVTYGPKRDPRSARKPVQTSAFGSKPDEKKPVEEEARA